MPADLDALLALDGIGSYTAAAVATFAHGRRHAVVDTNVRRVLVRAVSGRALPAPSLTAAEPAPRRVAGARRPRPRAALGDRRHGARRPRLHRPRPRLPRLPGARPLRLGARGQPPHDGPARRTQGFDGTDRQVRGRLLAVLRAAPGPVTDADLAAAVPDADLRDPAQRTRCLASLVEDGLVDAVALGWALPA
ncbi:hypothetical protein GCM10025868_30190 [Angustibacter aerolatus]|uniref:Adenine DNA glycosylase n=1 Tax=Angustibacter aerolatus TaxID=1162965 RepID=A0ABQ6JKU6_9ACTN|nr:hypothetical protein [Angustibacter aerolatus]GMA87769.1 hypothetical protein GCM10025868_30190 [Angustibacter aerolatus]